MTQKSSGKGQTHVADSVANTFEWLITAFILAFVFRAFVMEAFRIPTGSMADTLKGAHFRLRCTQCGFRYDHGFEPYKYHFPEEYIPPAPLNLRTWPRCPSCGYYIESHPKLPVVGGDRILVLKTLYQFKQPDRWDVVVFKNPWAPRINYIKRLVGRPGEKVQIIDGDVYIDGKIARKPPKVQQELWMPVYHNDYQPVQPNEQNFNDHEWRQPFENTGESIWEFKSPTDPTVFTLNAPKDVISTAAYNPAVGNALRAAYAYNDSEFFSNMPVVSDLKLSFNADFNEETGVIGIALSKYGILYRASIDPNGLMSISASVGASEPNTLVSKKLESLPKARFVPVSFEIVDHMLSFTIAENTITKDLGLDPNDAGPRDKLNQPDVAIFGSGTQMLSHIQLDRDTQYLEHLQQPGSVAKGLGSEKRAITLGSKAEGSPNDEYFVLGDNSPNSADSRWWTSFGYGNNNTHYRIGIVPHDYLVGKAMFVYWPAGWKPFANPKFPAIVPNFGALRFIYGGVPGYN